MDKLKGEIALIGWGGSFLHSQVWKALRDIAFQNGVSIELLNPKLELVHYNKPKKTLPFIVEGEEENLKEFKNKINEYVQEKNAASKGVKT